MSTSNEHIVTFFWSKPVQRELLLEHGMKRTGILSWGLPLGKEITIALVTLVVLLLFSLKQFYMGRFYCDFAKVIETKLFLNILCQDFKDVIQCERCNKYKVDRIILEIYYPEIPPLLDVVRRRQQIQDSGLRYSVDGDLCINMRSVLSRYLLPTSCNGVSHTTLNVPVYQIIKFVVMTSLKYGDMCNLVFQKAWKLDTAV